VQVAVPIAAARVARVDDLLEAVRATDRLALDDDDAPRLTVEATTVRPKAERPKPEPRTKKVRASAPSDSFLAQLKARRARALRVVEDCDRLLATLSADR
jgi:hypothetical protein